VAIATATMNIGRINSTKIATKQMAAAFFTEVW
jgi:hypothetical protein